MTHPHTDTHQRFIFTAAHASDLATLPPEYVGMVMQQLPYIIERLRAAAACNVRDGLGPLRNTLSHVSFVQGVSPPGKSQALQLGMAEISAARAPLARALPRRIAHITDLHMLSNAEAVLLARNLPMLCDAMRRIKGALPTDTRLCDAIPFISIDSGGFQVARNLAPPQTMRAAGPVDSPRRRFRA